MKGERLTKDHPRHPHTKVPDGFHGFPAGVCPWCSGEPDKHDGMVHGSGEGCDPAWYVVHNGPCPRVKRMEFNEHGGIAVLELGPPYVRLRDL